MINIDKPYKQVNNHSDSHNKPLRNVWLVEDNTSYRESIGLIIDQAEGFICLQQFSAWEKAGKKLEENTGSPPDIILSDIGLPGMSGIEGAALARKKAPGTPVIMLTVHDEDEKVFDAICAGAVGYLLKSATELEIIEAMEQALKGGSPMNAGIARKVLQMFARLNTPAKQYDLTDREKEILILITEGHTKKAISLELNISFHTVDSHIRHIYEKLEVNCRSDAVAKAIRERLI